MQKGSLHVIYLQTKQFSLAHSKFFLSKEIFITVKLDIIFSPNHLGDFFPPFLKSSFQVYFYGFSPGCYKNLKQFIVGSLKWFPTAVCEDLCLLHVLIRAVAWCSPAPQEISCATCLFTSKGALALRGQEQRQTEAVGVRLGEWSLEDAFMCVCVCAYTHVRACTSQQRKGYNLKTDRSFPEKHLAVRSTISLREKTTYNSVSSWKCSETSALVAVSSEPGHFAVIFSQLSRAAPMQRASAHKAASKVVQEGRGHMYSCGWIMLMYETKQCNTIYNYYQTLSSN